MEKVIMYCYTGQNWDETPIAGRGLYDITDMTPERVAQLADIQQGEMHRNIHIKREVKDDFQAYWDDGTEM